MTSGDLHVCTLHEPWRTLQPGASYRERRIGHRLRRLRLDDPDASGRRYKAPVRLGIDPRRPVPGTGNVVAGWNCARLDMENT